MTVDNVCRASRQYSTGTWQHGGAACIFTFKLPNGPVSLLALCTL